MTETDYGMNELFKTIDYNCMLAVEMGHLYDPTTGSGNKTSATVNNDKIFKEQNILNFEELSRKIETPKSGKDLSFLDTSLGFDAPLTWAARSSYDSVLTPSRFSFAKGFEDSPKEGLIKGSVFPGDLTRTTVFPFSPQMVEYSGGATFAGHQYGTATSKPYSGFHQPYFTPGPTNNIDVEMLKHASKMNVELSEAYYLEGVNRKANGKNSTQVYKCPWDMCEKTFGRFYNLKSHYRTHSGEKPFQCELCNASFARNHDLKRHQRTHSGQKPYNCNICKKPFSRQDALNRHINNHHSADGKKEKASNLESYE